MEPIAVKFQIGDWCFDPKASEISRKNRTIRLDFRSVRLLLCLAERAGQVVCIDDLLANVWSGVSVSQDSVYQAVTLLRRQLGDDPKNPAYIQTVPRLGYRMIAQVSPSEGAPVSSGRRSRVRLTVLAAALCVTLLGAALFVGGKFAKSRHAAPAPAPQQNSVAVLPFLDLTEGMQEETFADGMTEELIDKLSKVPGLRVPAPTASFFYKRKQIPVADVARALRVKYVLDGSVRKSGDMVRVAARLVQAENGFIIWSETYDRPFTDILMVQDDIAGEVAKKLTSSIGGRAEQSG